MWLVTGPFDNEQISEDIPYKTKLLRAATTYRIGRQPDCALRINSKKISRNHGELIIGTSSEDDVTDPAAIPSLTFQNTRDVDVRATRDKSFVIAGKTSRPLESGDVMRFITGVDLTVSWHPIVCFVSEDNSTFNRATCASLGIKLSTNHTRDVTHHLTQTVPHPLPASILLSLLNQAVIVTPQWLTTLLDSADSLCQTYKPPIEKDYTPNISPQLSTIHQNPGLLSPNKDRKNVFVGLTFIFAVIGSGIGSETKAMADVVLRGGGERNMVDVEKEAAGDVSKSSWESLLKKKTRGARKDSKSSLVIVAEDAKMRERGIPRDIHKTWDKMLEKANIAGFRVIHPSAVSDAILKADVSLLDCTISSEDAHKQLNTTQMELDEPVRPEGEKPVDKEPSPQMESSTSQPTRRLTRRAASRLPVAEDPPPLPPAVTQEPSASVADNKRKEPDSGLEEDTAPKKKVLKRRAKTTGLVNALLGLNDDPTDNQPPPSSETLVLEEAVGAAAVNIPVPPSPAVSESQPRRPLKRRARNNSQSQFAFLQEEEGPGAPSLKKFKSLFEESGRGEVNSLSAEDEDALGLPRTTNLEVLREEEEETQSPAQAITGDRHLGPKDGPALIENNVEAPEDVTMQDSQPDKRLNEPSVTDARRATARESSGSKPTNETDSNAKTKPRGAEPGKPDTDVSFLKAIASLKRGKRTEDNFDREFNQLRISKPNVQSEKSKENEAPWTWEGWDDLGRDIGIRGNFMQIVEMEVWRDQQRAERYQGERLDWKGRDNFKKFKKKFNNAEREQIVLEPVGTDEHFEESSIDYRPRPRPTKKRIPSLDVLVEYDDDEHQEAGHPILTNKTKATFPKTRAPPRPAEKPLSSNRKFSKTIPVDDLELEDNDEDEIRPLTRRTLRKTSAQPPASSSRKTNSALFIEDSEDEIEQVTVPKRARSTQSQSQSQSQSLGQSQSQDIMDVGETLKSDPEQASQTQTQTQTRGLKRKAAFASIAEDEDDNVGTFGGFSRRAASKRRR